MVTTSLRRCGQAWSAEGLLADFRVLPGPLLRRSLGRCYPARGLARVSTIVLALPPEIQDEVICHEAAHYVVFAHYGPRVRPHGPEWQALMEAAGVPARVRIQLPPRAPRIALRRSRRIAYEHRCPVCHASWVAWRRMTRWRCRDCVTVGLDGRLAITARSEQGLPL